MYFLAKFENLEISRKDSLPIGMQSYWFIQSLILPLSIDGRDLTVPVMFASVAWLPGGSDDTYFIFKYCWIHEIVLGELFGDLFSCFSPTNELSAVIFGSRFAYLWQWCACAYMCINIPGLYSHLSPLLYLYTLYIHKYTYTYIFWQDML